MTSPQSVCVSSLFTQPTVHHWMQNIQMCTHMCYNLHLDHYLTWLILCEERNCKDFTKKKLLQFINTIKRHQAKQILFENTLCNWRKQQPTVTNDIYLPNNAALPFQLFRWKRVKVIYISIGRQRYDIPRDWSDVCSIHIYLPVVVCSIYFSV